MFKSRIGLVLRVIAYLLAGVLLISSTGRIEAQGSEEQTLWNLERQYWRYVEGNDLQSYLGLWHKDFLGWPSMSAAPLDKDHITDWITSQTSKGLAFKTVDFKPAAIRVTGDVAVTCYWITYRWSDKDGSGATRTLRVTHTWLRGGKDYLIIGGMSMAEATTLRSNAKR
jgi:ketosteroid isomerase-like protein